MTSPAGARAGAVLEIHPDCDGLNRLFTLPDVERPLPGFRPTRAVPVERRIAGSQRGWKPPAAVTVEAAMQPDGANRPADLVKSSPIRLSDHRHSGSVNN